MYKENIEKISASAKMKSEFINYSLMRFIVLAIFAGVFVGIAVMLVFSVAAPLHASASPFTKLAVDLDTV